MDSYQALGTCSGVAEKRQYYLNGADFLGGKGRKLIGLMTKICSMLMVAMAQKENKVGNQDEEHQCAIVEGSEKASLEG